MWYRTVTGTSVVLQTFHLVNHSLLHLHTKNKHKALAFVSSLALQMHFTFARICQEADLKLHEQGLV